jgi:fatty acid desaturase
MPDAATATPPAAPTLGAEAPAAPAVPDPKIRWYRSPIEREDMKRVLSRSDLLATLQTGGYLLTILATGAATIWAYALGLWWAVLPLLFLHGTVCAFLINAVHELGHETVFRSRKLNRLFAGLFAFPGWINHLHFAESHGRHHRYTLHRPADLEVTLPITLRFRDFWRYGFFNPGQPVWSVKWAWQVARGRLEGEWNQILFAEHPEARGPVVRWARFLLLGHAAILIASLAMHWWIVPLVVSFPQIFGGGLQWLCNNTQHVGLVDNVPDARLCCRTIIINPVSRFLYWHMNFHTEHHMFAAVPCYRLGELHRLMKDDLPPCPVGLRATWTHILDVMAKQAADPTYRYLAPLPAARTAAA